MRRSVCGHACAIKLGFKFRRQCPVGPYFADFCCKKARLVIELDGDQHASAEGQQHDANRTAYLAERDYDVVRFTNYEVLLETDNVVERIAAWLMTLTAKMRGRLSRSRERH